MNILTLNCGSSSVKYSVFQVEDKKFLCRGIVERVGNDSLVKHKANDVTTSFQQSCKDHQQAVALVLDVLTVGEQAVVEKESIHAVGHRVVHGGERFSHSERITPALIQAVEEVAHLAPLHNPMNLAGIRAVSALLGDVPQVAVFDTAFHQSMPEHAYLYALPYEWYQHWGVRRYGFHGTSHLYVSHRASAWLGQPLSHLKIISLHIGNGASAAAVCLGKSIDTTMGFTPLEGLVMGTRCGSIDAAIPLYVMEREDMDPANMDRVLNKQSGILGVSGVSADRRDVLALAESEPRCRTALDLEAYQLRKTIGAYAAAMGGLDCVVFTAGVGENAHPIRKQSLSGLGFLGIELDQQKNQDAVGGLTEMAIHTDNSRVAILVIPTNEERVIAEDTSALVQSQEATDFRYSFS